MRPSEWDALRAEDEQDYRDRTGPYAPAGQPTYPRSDHPDLIDLDTGDECEGYAHEGDHDVVWSRDDLVKPGTGWVRQPVSIRPIWPSCASVTPPATDGSASPPLPRHAGRYQPSHALTGPGIAPLLFPPPQDAVDQIRVPHRQVRVRLEGQGVVVPALGDAAVEERPGHPVRPVTDPVRELSLGQGLLHPRRRRGQARVHGLGHTAGRVVIADAQPDCRLPGHLTNHVPRMQLAYRLHATSITR